ncbi:MAG: tRNA (adenosine(37)-N6)-threonylcarbamoyltransferase complex transferase subunit TsaD [Anaerococcus sp.]|uniref:tRNA (adenosine(37)-N6)-threonylcarbamoyltransferase complex transferase subunit TsaD n=1 Tax=Anaerococcus sp. TaxID=1872515 RepID=UPI00262B2A7E|nr:tRNA (adenosine(37)-N6)-threonylcarbamoyltransferase complex transferase subunit TsaD [Anaerococcus sp.]MCI5971578.1 tRNA (adenosine(37)-N6)-threonylcarbamoyltransferase complex transferase subunit TsaD [Anaerococcus sp.]MDD6919489.1 tRNA (adenosine(37)-N6)-threonylcarbamoyltransferase complex transferase subunit TsaD [Peptoniphilaceae bacterium]MDY2927550.1 tRNA (adenosine(37)-N6)-threonylcarbamoyltransferase complex transferase subunit TsaD [Anaerococcus sp.]
MSDFYTMGIETSCDDSSVAILKNDREVLVNLISSQIDIHALFGGVVPEIASRKHLEAINPLIEKALADTNLSYEDIDLISVTKGPGLMGSLLVGISAAKGLSLATNTPLIGANHMQGHICANYLSNKDLEPPFISLVVSGGHTYLCKVNSYTDYEVIGKTLDDAAGESFDKVARKIGLGYPGGPKIDKLAKEGNKDAIDFPRVMLEKGSYDFSFSGLKTAVLNYAHKLEQRGEEVNKADLAASFQEAVVDVLVDKSMMLLKETGLKTLAVSGGVAANSRLKERLKEECDKEGIKFYHPSVILCTDNAAMIAMAGYLNYKNGAVDDNFMKVYPNLEL